MYPSTSGDAIPSYPMDTGQSRTTFHDWPPVIMDDGILDSSATEIPKSQSRANRAIIHTHRRKRRNGPAGKHPHTPTGGQGRQAGSSHVSYSKSQTTCGGSHCVLCEDQRHLGSAAGTGIAKAHASVHTYVHLLCIEVRGLHRGCSIDVRI